eukprot:CAMPEP_0197865162 /NCGR_PEP_ID=MMETSP1438-20131217/43505_1 /TAXON_ID=1461541 /ORGANISM="Pterosperma sp., Strain CCMP1384" /LENGTH=1001 /DNA_ID=CAMNT_0043483585 /DNA_START=331 /DNA_END=3336 /DNA_ORIENTATION=-
MSLAAEGSVKVADLEAMVQGDSELKRKLQSLDKNQDGHFTAKEILEVAKELLAKEKRISKLELSHGKSFKIHEALGAIDDPQIKKTIESFDSDGNGLMDINELLKIAQVRVSNEAIKRQQSERIQDLKQQRWKLVAAMICLCLIICGVMLALVIAGVEAAKDDKPDQDGTLKMIDGTPVSTEFSTATASLADLAAYDANTLTAVERVSMVTDDDATLIYSISHIARYNENTIHLHTSNGHRILVDGGEVTVVGEKEVVGTISRRRLLSDATAGAATIMGKAGTKPNTGGSGANGQVPCMLYTEEGPTDKGVQCHFPFFHKGKDHFTCTTEGVSNAGGWCYTNSKFSEWAYCTNAAHCTGDANQIVKCADVNNGGKGVRSRCLRERGEWTKEPGYCDYSTQNGCFFVHEKCEDTFAVDGVCGVMSNGDIRPSKYCKDECQSRIAHPDGRCKQALPEKDKDFLCNCFYSGGVADACGLNDPSNPPDPTKPPSNTCCTKVTEQKTACVPDLNMPSLWPSKAIDPQGLIKGARDYCLHKWVAPPTAEQCSAALKPDTGVCGVLSTGDIRPSKYCKDECQSAITTGAGSCAGALPEKDKDFLCNCFYSGGVADACGLNDPSNPPDPTKPPSDQCCAKVNEMKSECVPDEVNPSMWPSAVVDPNGSIKGARDYCLMTWTPPAPSQAQCDAALKPDTGVCGVLSSGDIRPSKYCKDECQNQISNAKGTCQGALPANDKAFLCNCFYKGGVGNACGLNDPSNPPDPSKPPSDQCCAQVTAKKDECVPDTSDPAAWPSAVVDPKGQIKGARDYCLNQWKAPAPSTEQCKKALEPDTGVCGLLSSGDLRPSKYCKAECQSQITSVGGATCEGALPEKDKAFICECFYKGGVADACGLNDPSNPPDPMALPSDQCCRKVNEKKTECVPDMMNPSAWPSKASDPKGLIKGARDYCLMVWQDPAEMDTYIPPPMYGDNMYDGYNMYDDDGYGYNMYDDDGMYNGYNMYDDDAFF